MRGHNSRGSAHSLADRVAERLSADVCQTDIDRLEPHTILAERYQCSPSTMLAALRALRHRGILTFGRGQPLRVVRADNPPPLGPARGTSREELAREIEREIVAGLHRVGAPLPKVSYTAGLRGISNKTVGQAYRELERRGLAHRKGRLWVAGGRQKLPERTSAPPVILILSVKEQDWRGLHVERTRSFCREFAAESERGGTQIVPVVTRSARGLYTVVAQGRAQVMRYVQKLGIRYRGTLVITPTAREPQRELWMQLLASRGGPVVWFDRHGEGPLEAALRGPNVSRCHFSERAAVRLCVEHLVEMGHRRIAYVNRGEGWQQNREHILREEASVLLPSLEVISNEPQDDVDKALRSLLEAPRPTAIVAPNDTTARAVFYRLRDAGLRVGKDISLISFDNSVELLPLPVTTIDFGFDYLGYAAYHLIARDIVIPRDPDGDVPTIPRLVRRGSVGRVPGLPGSA